MTLTGVGMVVSVLSHCILRWSRLGAFGLILGAGEPLVMDTLRAQQAVPVGARRLSAEATTSHFDRSWQESVRWSAPDSSVVERMQHALWGAAIGGIVGIAVGYERGKASDRRCGSECGGPVGIAPLVEGVFFGLVGSALGAVVGYAL